MTQGVRGRRAASPGSALFPVKAKMNGKHMGEQFKDPRACGVHDLLQSNAQAQSPSGPNTWDGELFKDKVKGTSQG